jgi:hypothetical protein
MAGKLRDLQVHMSHWLALYHCTTQEVEIEVWLQGASTPFGIQLFHCLHNYVQRNE